VFQLFNAGPFLSPWPLQRERAEYFTPHRQVGGFGSPETTTAGWSSSFDDFLLFPSLPRDAKPHTTIGLCCHFRH
jgi:hypothetical protein